MGNGTGFHSRELTRTKQVYSVADISRYNVTPTAAYTYAPAYRRYGHKINAVHFIGPHKPWANLQYRPAGVSRPASQDQSYDCMSLVPLISNCAYADWQTPT